MVHLFRLLNAFLLLFGLVYTIATFKLVPAELQLTVFYGKVCLTLGVIGQGIFFVTTLATSYEVGELRFNAQRELIVNDTVFNSLVHRLTGLKNNRACLFGLWFLALVLSMLAADYWLLSLAVASRTLTWLTDIHTEILYEKRGLDLKSIKQDPVIRYLLGGLKKKD